MENKILNIDGLSAGYGENWIVNNIDLSFTENKVTAIMGPSGCGKSTLIRCINRMHELTPDALVTGKIMLNGENLYDLPPVLVRKQIGMVFQKANPFPTMSIYDNVLAGYTLNGHKLSKSNKDEIVEEALSGAALWDEVKDSLYKKGTFLSGGQQQRLCIARTLAMKPDILLLDEPTSALDPKATNKVEELIEKLIETVTIVLVTHNIAQAARISDYTAFLYLGELIEFDKSKTIFTTPKHKKTGEYLTGKFG